MLTKRSHAPLGLILAAALASACANPSAPSRPTPLLPSPTPSPTQSPRPTDVWNVTVRLTSAVGGDCAGETMQSQIGVESRYSLGILPKGSAVDVILRSASGDYACTFPAVPDGDGFTTFGVNGWMSCETSGVVRGFVCANGVRRDLLRMGENISGRISGNEISGRWHVSWIVMTAGGDLGGRDDIAGLETTAQFTGTRQ
jgi:hypothetical protein